jgi:NTP pyrophosphatase (non-canonical NTP hydrolase)
MNSVESEIMDIAQEECAEVIQAISKVRRFGWLSKHPSSQQTNRQHLEEEIGDLMCMVDLMREQGMIDWAEVIEHSDNKREKLKKWSNIT